ncbi:MAG: metallophosphoesterase, partial [Armatimonadota bacterium]|nr:metallophosphoesterase [Armatimonadota bacterium]
VMLLAALVLLAARVAVAQPWSFGVMSDTQWSPAEGHPGLGVATEIIDDVNQQFVKAGVKFVIQVGDLTDRAGKGALEELDIRARHNAALAAAGIRFFPLRGNHDDSPEAAARFAQVFPGLPGTKEFRPTGKFGGGSSPDLPGLGGLTYSFVYDNALFVLLDQFSVSANGEKKSYRLTEQQPWISAQLAQAKATGRHAFVFAHRNLFGQQHKDNLFGSPPKDAKDDAGDGDAKRRDAATVFIRSMAENGSRLFFSGHDHIYHRAWVAAPDAPVGVKQIIAGSCSYKLYAPKAPYSRYEYPVAQERNAIGYVIVTVDGPHVTARYYSVQIGRGSDSASTRSTVREWKAPAPWKVRDVFGYSQNGAEFLVRPGDSLKAVQGAAPAGSGFAGTRMAILSGENPGTGTTLDDDPKTRRPLARWVTTGWSPCPGAPFESDVLRLGGLRNGVGATRSMPYTLALTARPGWRGTPVLYARDATGKWRRAADLVAAGTPRRVDRPYREGDSLGSFGFDAKTGTAWAVIDFEGEFAVMAAPGRRAQR